MRAVHVESIAYSTGDGCRSHLRDSSCIDVNHRSSVIRVMWVSLPVRRASSASASASGIVGPGDIRRGFVETSLPAGKLDGAVRPESVNGEVHATDPIFLAGRTIVRPWFKIEAGRIVKWGAEDREDLLNHALVQSKVSTARVGFFSVGLNPVAEACMLDNGIVKDDVGIGLGPHPQLERRAADPSVSFTATTGPVRLEIGP